MMYAKEYMKLLITTQIIDQDDPVLGFFVRWVEEFAKHAEHVEVICLREGKYNLPENVHVHSLGKENKSNNTPRFARRITYAFRFISLIWRLRHNYDTVFVHMNPEYVILGGKLWRLLGKRTALWYTHKNVDWKLRIAVLFANVVFTASRESFRLKSKKVKVVGHGIDMKQFIKKAQNMHSQDTSQTCLPLRVLTIGRISETKRIKEMLHAFEIFSKRGQDFIFTIAGAPATDSDIEYEKQVHHIVANSSYSNNIHFIGAVAHKDVPSLLVKNDVFLNLSETGSMDKAVLEALATGIPVVTTNIAFRDLLSPIQGLFITEATPEKIVNALVLALTSDVSAITNQVREHCTLPHLIKTICSTLAK